jgi:hypothetical protein
MGSQNSPAGAIDVIAVRRPDGSISCSPFHVKLAKASKKGEKKIVNLKVNGQVVDLSMKVGPAGEAFFVERTREYSRRESAICQETSHMTNVDVGDPMSPREYTEDTCSPLPPDVPQRLVSNRSSREKLVSDRSAHTIASTRLVLVQVNPLSFLCSLQWCR